MNKIKALYKKTFTKNHIVHFKVLLEMFNNDKIEIDHRIPDYRWKTGDIYRLKESIEKYLQRGINRNHYYDFSKDVNEHDWFMQPVMEKHPINADRLLFYLIKESDKYVFKPYVEESDKVYRYDDYPKSMLIDNNHITTIDCPSGKLIYTGYELFNKLGVANELDDWYVKNISRYGCEECEIDTIEHFLTKMNIFVSIRGCTGGIFKKGDEYLLTDYHESYMAFDEDAEDEEPYFSKERIEYLESCGEYIGEMDTNSDKTVLIFDSSLLPENTPESDYGEIEIGKGFVQITSNIYFYQDDPNKVNIRLRLIK